MHMTASERSHLDRIDSLREMISAREIHKQEELVAALQAAGYSVTQSSVSRDLSEIGAHKVNGIYVFPDDRDPTLAAILTAASAGPNILVLKTLIGAAQRVAYTIDAANKPEIVGTVAGDDTIFLATSGKEAHSAIKKWLGVGQ
jgi:transcriptional regulator of arginine metabolism